MGTEDLFVYNKEKEEEILRKVGCRDLIELMICRNCKNHSNGICKIRIDEKTKEQLKVKLEETCGLWDERIEPLEKEEFSNLYFLILKVLKKYCDLKEEAYNLVALWIIGTYLHNNFSTYPYLFFNAMKGSGKTRLLNLISKLSKNGKLVSNMSEAVLFRTAKDRALCIDEFERVTSREKMALRELLNSAYKKGMSVERVYKTKKENPETHKYEEKYEIESFDVYCPIAMANIWGLEDVLSDRCITLILEKSIKKEITRLIELFDEDLDIKEIKRTFSVGSAVSDGSYNIYMPGWNDYLILHYTDTTDTTYTTNTTNTTDTKVVFFNKIRETTLEGRNLELFFPLFLISWFCGVLDETIKTAEELVKSKKEEDMSESRDISFINFLASKLEEQQINDFIPLRNLVQEFKSEDEDWVTSEWVGRALKRLDLTTDKRRIARGREVKINWKKAQEKIKIFK